MKKSANLYLLFLIVLVAIWFLITNGDSVFGSPLKSITTHTIHNASISLQGFAEKLVQVPGILIMQLIIIILVVRIIGYLFQLTGQPLVIGEIIAGLILGPSVLGTLAPGVSAFVFPAASINVLHQLSQLGLIFFMFIIGMELDTSSFKKTANVAVMISFASIIFPFTAGIILAYYLYGTFALVSIKFTSFALFMGTTMCITAFPVLARIVQERKLTKTPVGTMSLTVAAIGDVVAWCILAVVVAIVKAGDIRHALLTILLSVIYILLMFYAVKPFMYRIGRVYSSRESMGRPIVALVFLLILGSSLITEAIGIHALFGAFMAGVMMPENLSFKRVFTEKIEDISLVILLPLFFVATGLRTEIGLINSVHLWLVCLMIIAVATVSKIGGTLLTSRYAGLSWNHSLVLGVLMNTRGLMELIVLNIGYELGILTPEIFSMLVLMALITTLLTGPGLSFVNYLFPAKSTGLSREKPFKVMLSFANPKMGISLLNLTNQLVLKKAPETVFTALHISPRTDLSPDDAGIFEKESFAPVRRFAEKQNLSLTTIYRNTHEIYSEIIQTCKSENPDFLILGSARTIFSTDIMGGMLKRIIHESPCDVLVFNERNFKLAVRVLIMYYGNGDEFLLDYAGTLNQSGNRSIFIHKPDTVPENSALIHHHVYESLIPIDTAKIDQVFMHSLDMVWISENNRKNYEESSDILVKNPPSLLILHKGIHKNRMFE
jgi:Kef-type K+ transport system membrane component KefB